MEWLKKNYKVVTGALVILILIEIVVAWYLIEQFRQNYLSGEEALGIALSDAGLSQEDAADTDIDLETKAGKAWYEIEFETAQRDYHYRIDAETGEVLAALSEPGSPD
ncbi:MAG: PepSY domain-containing protein [Oscillospiraceae bacterium]|nr:PepSY domain-containing protein [Oscillospiraceae bacterium]